ncbi:YlmC/YmxH family sporulation protein [Brassicibacter mesophilus]|jgi:YlmC/YmxH family sporulation protein|uniref:YlmC/YmxH family sporulation protein n=1 Tax=Brassicibacter mesophilus TaxID=745119 RepID=UPI003D1AD3EE
MVKTSDLREKEVVNVRDGARLGLISDIEVNLEKGLVEAIVIPGPGKILGFFGRNQEFVIRWKNIVRIGSDVILVDFNFQTDAGLSYNNDDV